MNGSIAANHDLFRLLWRRKFFLLLSSLMTGIAVLVVAASLPPRYVGEGLLLVETHEPRVPELGILASSAPDASLQNRTESDVLRSRALIETVVRELNLVSYPEYAAGAGPSRFERLVGAIAEAARAVGGPIGMGVMSLLPPPVPKPDTLALMNGAADVVRRNLQVTQTENSSVLSVRFTAGSPLIAAAVVNALLDHYIAGEVAARRNVMLQTNRWLSERASALWPEVENADRAVRKFREANPLLEVAQGSLTALQLNNEETDLSLARQELVRRQAELEAARKTGFKDALASPLLQQLREREADESARMTIIAHRLGVRHPDYIAAASSLQDVRREIEAATNKVVAAMEQEVTNAASRVADLQARIAASEKLAEQSASAAVELAQLTREADAKRRVYEAFMTRAAETQPTSAQFPPARVISPAIPPQRPDRIPLPIVGVFGALAGFCGAGALSILRHVQSGGFGSARELATTTGMPCLGALPALPPTRPDGPANLLDRRNRHGAVETLRAMHLEIQATAETRGNNGSVVLITSSEIGEGKTTLAASFARVCATDGQRVLLIEADLRRPRLASLFGFDPRPDIESAASTTGLLADVVQVDLGSGLHCLTASGCILNPQELFRTHGFRSLLARARRDYDLVVIDSPPVLRVVDPLLVARICDMILFVVRWDRTPRALVAEGLRRLPEEQRRRAATILTRVPAERLGKEDYYAGYHHRSRLGFLSLTLLPPRQRADAPTQGGHELT